jgi:hypothetical protein
MVRKPIRRFLPLTYQAKIQRVWVGIITQSIRINTDLQVDDSIAFHGWSGKPYHSPWSFRTPYMRVRHAEWITVRKDSIYFLKEKVAVKACDLNYLAALDGIEPETGEELIRVLHAMHGKGTLHGKILRWDPAPLKTEQVHATIKESAPFVIKPDPTQIDNLGRIRMCEGDFDPLLKPRHTPPHQDFVQQGAFDKSGTACEGIKEGFVLIRNKEKISRDIPVSLH